MPEGPPTGLRSVVPGWPQNGQKKTLKKTQKGTFCLGFNGISGSGAHILFTPRPLIKKKKNVNKTTARGTNHGNQNIPQSCHRQRRRRRRRQPGESGSGARLLDAGSRGLRLRLLGPPAGGNNNRGRRWW